MEVPGKGGKPFRIILNKKWFNSANLLPNKPFWIVFKEDWFKKNDILKTTSGSKLKILRTPYKTWYRKLVYYITFKRYTLPTGYKVKVIK